MNFCTCPGVFFDGAWGSSPQKQTFLHTYEEVEAISVQALLFTTLK